MQTTKGTSMDVQTRGRKKKINLSIIHNINLRWKIRPYTDDGLQTVSPRDHTLFIKQLRNVTKAEIKYYGISDYGGKYQRPHYHYIMFNTPHEYLIREWDKKLRKFRAPEIENIWQMGQCDAEYPNGGALSYVTGYVDSKLSTIGTEDTDSRTKNRAYISKGIGTGHLTTAKKAYYKKRLTNFLTIEDGKKVPMPRLFKQKIYTEDEIKAISIKNQLHATSQDPQTFEQKKRIIQKEKKFLYNRKKKDVLLPNTNFLNQTNNEQ